jgi:hypothetical protein
MVVKGIGGVLGDRKLERELGNMPSPKAEALELENMGHGEASPRLLKKSVSVLLEVVSMTRDDQISTAGMCRIS